MREERECGEEGNHPWWWHNTKYNVYLYDIFSREKMWVSEIEWLSEKERLNCGNKKRSSIFAREKKFLLLFELQIVFHYIYISHIASSSDNSNGLLYCFVSSSYRYILFQCEKHFVQGGAHSTSVCC